MGKIIIRKIGKSDTQSIIKWRNTPEVQCNFIYQEKLEKEEHERWMEHRVATGEVVQFIIVDDEIGDVGSVYLRDIDMKNKKAEFGIFIGEEIARGKGIGTKAAKLILDYAFTEMNLNKVFLRVFANNLGAIRSYEKVGFQSEGIFREDVIVRGCPKDVLFMGILKREWEM